MESAVMEEQPRQISRPVLIKRGSEIPPEARLMSDSEVLDYQLNRINKFPHNSKMYYIFNYSTFVFSAVAGLTGIAIVSTMRKNFQLGGLSKLYTYGPAAFVPSASAAMLHEFGIKNRVLLGRETCPLCVSLKSGLYQTLLSTCYPLFVSFICCIPVARKNYTLPLPATKGGFGYIRLFKLVCPKSSLLLQFALGNFLVGYLYGSAELKLFYEHLSS